MTAEPVKKIVVLGSGGHAKVVIDILLADLSVEVIGCTGSALANGMRVPLLGDDRILPELLRHGVQYAIAAVGDNRLRSSLAAMAESIGFQLVNAVSLFAYVSGTAMLGTGVAVMPGAVIQPDVRIGNASIINTGASVDHDGRIGDACHLAPGCNLAGSVTVGSYTFLGTGAKVIDGIHIGKHCIIGAGAVVIRDIPDGSTAVGVPARIIRRTVEDDPIEQQSTREEDLKG